MNNILSLKVWFQNRRAKWKKQRKSNSLLHSPSPLLPSHSLPPLGVTSISTFSSSWAPNGYSGLVTTLTHNILSNICLLRPQSAHTELRRRGGGRRLHWRSAQLWGRGSDWIHRRIHGGPGARRGRGTTRLLKLDTRQPHGERVKRLENNFTLTIIISDCRSSE